MLKTNKVLCAEFIELIEKKGQGTSMKSRVGQTKRCQTAPVGREHAGRVIFANLVDPLDLLSSLGRFVAEQFALH